MSTATHLVILASLASLVLGANLSEMSEEEKEEQMMEKENEEQIMDSLPIECCELDKALPPIFTDDPDKCPAGSILQKVVESKKGKAKEQKESCVVECILGEHSLLTEDKSVKEAELRKLFLTNVNPAAKDVMTAALGECFEDHNRESHKGDTCKSGAEELLTCIMSEVYTNCPKTMWKMEDEQCKSYKIALGTLLADAA